MQKRKLKKVKQLLSSTAKLADLQDLKNKLSNKTEEKFKLMDSKFLSELHMRPDGELENSVMENNTSGVLRPQRAQGTDTTGMREPLISIENSLEYRLWNKQPYFRQ